MRALPIILAATALALSPASMAWADPGHVGHDHTVEATYGRPGDPAKGGRVVQVVMTETDSGMAFTPARVEIRQGEQIQFILRNGGELDHELVIGTVEANRQHAEAMAAHPD
ncbi:MAG: copper resistance protein, partial [Pseudomonadota bacterium]|nr:copper resistance protein [Pseudomonadota bacterium]